MNNSQRQSSPNPIEKVECEVNDEIVNQKSDLDTKDQNSYIDEDSYEAKANIGKPKDQLKFKNLIKERLRVTSIPAIKLYETDDGEIVRFSDLFTF